MNLLKRYLNTHHLILAVLGVFALVASLVTKDAQTANANDDLKLASNDGEHCDMNATSEEFGVEKKPEAFISCAGYLE